jgi:hypothetical protein
MWCVQPTSWIAISFLRRYQFLKRCSVDESMSGG